MKLTNTSGIDSAHLRRLLAFARPQDLGTVNVTVSKKSKGSISAHAKVNLTVPRGARAHRAIHFTINKDMKLPCLMIDKKISPRFSVWSLDEAIILVAAHEYRHIWQAIHPKGWRVHGSKGQYSERDAECAGIRAVRRWRKTNWATT